MTINGLRTDPPLGNLREADLSEVDWLAAADPHGSLGYAPLGWPAETWVLHRMWEEPVLDPFGARTLEERWRAEHPGETGIGTLSYAFAPFTELPPPEWPRLRWADLAARLGEPLTGGSYNGYPVPPCYAWFSIASWPESIWTPSEGTIDEPTGERLLAVFAEHGPDGPDGPETPCFAYYDILDSPDWFERVVLTEPLRAMLDAARYSTHHAGTPGNIWPADRSWLLMTDHDLWGTRLIGPRDLVDAVENDPELETVPFTYRTLPNRGG